MPDKAAPDDVAEVVTSEPVAASQPDSPAHAGKGSGLVVFLILVLVAAMAGGGYWFWLELGKRDQQLAAIQQTLESVKAGSKKQITDARQKLAEQQQQASAEMSKLVEQRFEETNRALAKLEKSDRADWLLAEAEYLLRLANQQVQLVGNSKQAVVFLKAADQILADIEAGYLHEVRKKIAEEIMALSLMDPVDHEGLFLRIEALIQHTDKVDVTELVELKNKNDTEKVETVSEDAGRLEKTLASVKQSFIAVIDKLGGFIRIHQHGDKPGDMLSPLQQEYVKQNLRLMLEQAQLAVLRKSPAIYTTSLTKAENWINDYYLINPAEKSRLLGELASIKSINIDQPLPDTSGSLQLLKKRILAKTALSHTISGTKARPAKNKSNNNRNK
jgi:uroporphyrin-3 C-methyltransferase